MCSHIRRVTGNECVVGVTTEKKKQGRGSPWHETQPQWHYNMGRRIYMMCSVLGSRIGTGGNSPVSAAARRARSADDPLRPLPDPWSQLCEARTFLPHGSCRPRAATVCAPDSPYSKGPTLTSRAKVDFKISNLPLADRKKRWLTKTLLGYKSACPARKEGVQHVSRGHDQSLMVFWR
jgi:hypothetical protein